MSVRSSGVLMPIFSLPSPYGVGTLGRQAREFHPARAVLYDRDAARERRLRL